MTATSRRGFLAGGVALAGLPAVAKAAEPHAAAPWPAAKRTLRHARGLAVSRDGRHVAIAHAMAPTVELRTGRSSRVVDLGAQPVDLALSPDHRLLAVTTGFWNDQPGLVVLRVADGEVLKRIETGPAPFAVAFTPDGRRILVAGGEQEGRSWIVNARSLEVAGGAPIGLVPRGLSMHPARRQAWVALNGDDSVACVDTLTGRVRRTLKTPRLPDRVAVSPDGRRVLVSHGGPDSDHVTDLDLRSGDFRFREVGRLASGVGWTRSGRGVVALGGSGEVAILGSRRTIRRRRVGGAPRGLVTNGSRAWTVDALTASLTAVRT